MSRGRGRARRPVRWHAGRQAMPQEGTGFRPGRGHDRRVVDWRSARGLALSVGDGGSLSRHGRAQPRARPRRGSRPAGHRRRRPTRAGPRRRDRTGVRAGRPRHSPGRRSCESASDHLASDSARDRASRYSLPDGSLGLPVPRTAARRPPERPVSASTASTVQAAWRHARRRREDQPADPQRRRRRSASAAARDHVADRRARTAGASQATTRPPPAVTSTRSRSAAGSPNRPSVRSGCRTSVRGRAGRPPAIEAPSSTIRRAAIAAEDLAEQPGDQHDDDRVGDRAPRPPGDRRRHVAGQASAPRTSPPRSGRTPRPAPPGAGTAMPSVRQGCAGPDRSGRRRRPVQSRPRPASRPPPLIGRRGGRGDVLVAATMRMPSASSARRQEPPSTSQATTMTHAEHERAQATPRTRRRGRNRRASGRRGSPARPASAGRRSAGGPATIPPRTRKPARARGQVGGWRASRAAT